jgi:nicotinamide mononucleotide transporter
MEAIEWVAAGLGLVSVWLNVREDWRGWPVGAVMVALYFAVFARVKLYADAGLQVIYFILQFYGWYEWVRGGEDHVGLTVSRTPSRVLWASLAVGVGATAIVGTLLGRYTDQALPYWDSGITAFSLVAQWMLARKYLENWLLWAAIDVVAIGVYWSKHLLPTAVLYACFLLLCLRGYQRWHMTLMEAQAQE